MSDRSSHRPPSISPPGPAPFRPRDILLNLGMYLYFTVGFLTVIAPWLLWLLVRWRGQVRRDRVQRLVSRFLRGFFWTLQRLGPPTRVDVPASVRGLRGQILVCNHISYLDPLLFMATFPRHQSVAKPTWFRVPLFGLVLRTMGYLAPLGSVRQASSLPERLQATQAHLAQGGVFFLFPEGHRSRDGNVGSFDPGAFKLGRLLDTDVVLLRISGTADVLPPGHVLPRAGAGAALRLEHLATLSARELGEARSIRALTSSAEAMYRSRPGSPAAP